MSDEKAEESIAGDTTIRVVGVCGFGRCGSTMLMKMLDVGGVRPVDGASPGSYETGSLHSEAIATALQPGRAIKLLDYILHDDLAHHDWRFIWVDRDHGQQAKSQVKFLDAIMGTRLPGASTSAFVKSYRRDRPIALERLRDLGPVLELRYEDVLALPDVTAERIARFLRTPMDVEAMASVVHRRKPKCLPDLAVELAVAREAKAS